MGELVVEATARIFAKRFGYRCRCGVAVLCPPAPTVDRSTVAAAGRVSAACVIALFSL